MEADMNSVVDALRNGEWLTRERVRLCAIALLVAYGAAVIFLCATANGLNDFKGRPLGADYSNVYAAGTLALDGQPDAPFDPERQFQRQQEIFGKSTQFYSWHYPPYFLLLAAPLAMLPYSLGLVLWQVGTLALYLFAIRAILMSFAPAGGGRSTALDPLWLPLALAFPAVFVNLGHGNNGFLTSALLGGMLVLLDRRPIISGILLACLVYKPQFGLLAPLVLALTGRWRVIGAAAATVIALTIVTTLAFGVDVWTAFVKWMPFTRVYVLEQGGPGWYKIQSVFSWVRLWGGSVPLAYALHGVAFVTLAGAVIWLWRRPVAFPLQAAGLCIATILATPYVLDYDLISVGIAIAYIAASGQQRGFLPYEKSALAFMWLVPLVARTIGENLLLPLAVPAMILLFALVMRRAADNPAYRTIPASFAH
jgi:hypothetical protein